MTNASERSLGDEATFPGRDKRQRADVSIGDERTLGDGLSGQDTVIDNIEVVDLETRYEIEGTLGQGGMGAVLLATDTRLDRKVAIKRILGEAAGNPMAVNRFLTEAKSIAALNHPNIVQIYDYGRAKDGPFLIMEFVDGGSLLDRCRDRAMPLEDAVNLACQLCDGLARAHDLGIIHRDIKPANILLTKDGTPKLTDFGLAKAQAGDHGQTMTGAVLGTPDFMPPEQRRDAAEADHRSDIWSLAATVYQMVTGKSPKVINLRHVPTQVHDVLGKALEDEREDRYQSAREIRDALKASLLATATRAAVAPVGEGDCPTCGIQNDAKRKFCRGCGGPLEAPCMACTEPMPMWDEICGSCGAKQTPLVDIQRARMATEQARAEGLLGDYMFDQAAHIATYLRDNAHPRLAFLAPWAETFLSEVEHSRSLQLERAVGALAEADRHEQSHDYVSAISALESLPAAMRSILLPGARETVAKSLDRITKIQAEGIRLESLVKSRLAARSIDGLLPEVKSLLRLHPHRQDVLKLHHQLVDRQQKQQTARDEAVAVARSLVAAKDYDGAVAALTNLPEAAMTPETQVLHNEAQQLATRCRDLGEEIRAAVACNRLDGLLDKVKGYLHIKPSDSKMVVLRQSLVDRETKIAAEIDAGVVRARRLEKACQFSEAAEALERIPPSRLSSANSAFFQRCLDAATLRSRTFHEITQATPHGYAKAVQKADVYRQFLTAARLDDAEFANAFARLEAAHTAEERRRRLQTMAASTAVVTVILVCLVAGGMMVRSNMRAAALARAITTDRWGEALAIDPANLAAYEGRARTKLAETPADVEGAFADIAALEKLTGETAAVKSLRAAAHATRAAALAWGDRPADAAPDLVEAVALDGDQRAVAKAREAIAAAWLARAMRSLDKRDLTGLRLAVDSAAKAGAEDGSLVDIWRRYAAGCIERMDATSFKTACAEATKRGCLPKDIATLWLRYADNVIKKGDLDSLQAAADAAAAAGATDDSLLDLWRRYAAACVERMDGTGLAIACAEAEKRGCARADIAALWLRYGNGAITRGEVPSVQIACDSAAKAGASQAMLNPLLAQAMAWESRDVFERGESKAAVSKAMKAIEKDAAAAVGMLMQTPSAPLREAVVREYRMRFDSLVAAHRWKEASVVNATAESLDPQARLWWKSSLTPETLLTISPDAVRALPPAALASLPPTAIVALAPVRNSIGIEIKLLPAGTFTMGEPGGDSVKTPHTVTLTQPFYIGVHEVTNAQWKRVMGTIPSKWQDDDHPVENVCWEDAVRFCEKLSALPEEQKAGRVYRLPTEAEWEYGCRAGTTTQYSFGNEQSILGQYSWFNDNSNNQTHPVGQKKPNVWGLYDMHGNVCEWCSDWYGDYPSGPMSDPSGPSVGSARIVRRGCWAENAEGCQSANRGRFSAVDSNDFLGFRLALSPFEIEPPKAEK